MDAGAKAAVQSFVSSGGGLIVHGFSSYADDFLNGVFGFAIGVEQSTTVSPLPKDASTTGTEFADDPATIPVNNGTNSLTVASLPAGSRTMYQGGTGLAAVARFLARHHRLCAAAGWANRLYDGRGLAAGAELRRAGDGRRQRGASRDGSRRTGGHRQGLRQP